MTLFVEYLYHEDPFFTDDTERDIQSITEANFQTVNVPDHAIGFSFIEADGLEQAKYATLKDQPVYYLGKPDEVMTTAEIRQRSRLYDLSDKMLRDHMDVESGNPGDALLEIGRLFENTSKDKIDDLADALLRPEEGDFHGDIMADFTANMMEQHGCHRVMGAWPMYCIGIQDKDIIIDRDTREIISPALKI